MINIYSQEDIVGIRAACRIVAVVLDEIGKIARPGMQTIKLDKIAHKLIIEQGAEPAFKGYRGFPGTLCTSVNNEVVHGIPSKRKLKSGDLLSIDVGTRLNGFYGDAAVTLAIGDVSLESARLNKVTMESIYLAIDQAVAGNRLGDISSTVQKHAEDAGFSIVRDFVGHGIGRKLHEEPQVPNFGKPDTGPLLRNGMVLALEPMVNMGLPHVYVKEDLWTAVTMDGLSSAHWEHTIAITASGPEILTRLD